MFLEAGKCKVERLHVAKAFLTHWLRTAGTMKQDKASVQARPSLPLLIIKSHDLMES
jgi:hypothetical protein